jgi:BASS family bile acid:Na+ symporter
MLLRARLGGGSRWVEAAHGAAAALVAIVLGIVLVTIADHLAMHWASHLPAALMLCTLMLGLSYGGAAAAGLDRPLRFTVAIEAGIHNVPIVVLLADQVLHRPELAGLAVVYVPVVAVMTLGWAALARRGRRPSFGAGATPMPGPR